MTKKFDIKTDNEIKAINELFYIYGNIYEQINYTIAKKGMYNDVLEKIHNSNLKAASKIINTYFSEDKRDQALKDAKQEIDGVFLEWLGALNWDRIEYNIEEQLLAKTKKIENALFRLKESQPKNSFPFLDMLFSDYSKKVEDEIKTTLINAINELSSNATSRFIDRSENQNELIQEICNLIINNFYNYEHSEKEIYNSQSFEGGHTREEIKQKLLQKGILGNSSRGNCFIESCYFFYQLYEALDALDVGEVLDLVKPIKNATHAKSGGSKYALKNVKDELSSFIINLNFDGYTYDEIYTFIKEYFNISEEALTKWRIEYWQNHKETHLKNRNFLIENFSQQYKNRIEGLPELKDICDQNYIKQLAIKYEKHGQKRTKKHKNKL